MQSFGVVVVVVGGIVVVVVVVDGGLVVVVVDVEVVVVEPSSPVVVDVTPGNSVVVVVVPKGAVVVVVGDALLPLDLAGEPVDDDFDEVSLAGVDGGFLVVPEPPVPCFDLVSADLDWCRRSSSAARLFDRSGALLVATADTPAPTWCSTDTAWLT